MPQGKDHEDTSKLDGHKIVYFNEEQFEMPLEYHRMSSRTFPTLPTIYRMRVLTLKLTHASASNFVNLCKKNKRMVSWIPAIHAKVFYDHQDLHDYASASNIFAGSTSESKLISVERPVQAITGCLPRIMNTFASVGNKRAMGEKKLTRTSSWFKFENPVQNFKGVPLEMCEWF